MERKQNDLSAQQAETPNADGTNDAEKAPAQRMPARYNLYARLNVSLKTMDIIITVLVVAIVAALVVGVIWK